MTIEQDHQLLERLDLQQKHRINGLPELDKLINQAIEFSNLVLDGKYITYEQGIEFQTMFAKKLDDLFESVDSDEAKKALQIGIAEALKDVRQRGHVVASHPAFKQKALEEEQEVKRRIQELMRRQREFEELAAKKRRFFGLLPPR